MAKSRSNVAATTSREHPLVKYFKDTRAELRKVTWPTREETKNLTLIIVAVTVAMAIFLGSLDYVFQVVVTGIVAGDVLRYGVAVVLFLAGAAAFYYNSQE